jgi:hypothetical protein
VTSFEPIMARTEFQERVNALHFFFRYLGRKDQRMSPQLALFTAASHFPDVPMEDIVDDMLSPLGVAGPGFLLFAVDPLAPKPAAHKKTKIGHGAQLIPQFA